MSGNLAMYEINTLEWLGEFSRKLGRPVKLGDVPTEQWDRLKRLGFDCVWIMGVWKRSETGLKRFQESPEWPRVRKRLDSALPGWQNEDLCGSPYSIAAYEPEPRIGTWEDIDRVREELHNRGMKMILDFVPNHTAPDHPWIIEHPDYYIQGTERDFDELPEFYFLVEQEAEKRYFARGRDPYFAPWPDTAQLNYFNEAAHTALIGELKHIAGHCDGVRCDMAMLVLNDIFENTWGRMKEESVDRLPEFWRQARSELTGFMLIAEAYWDLEWTLQQLGFDYVYDKRLYDRLRFASARDVNLHLAADLSFQNKLVRFIENHDEPRSAAVFGYEHLRASAVLFTTLPGMKLYHDGQIDGRRLHIPMLLSRTREESPSETMRSFYENLLSRTRSDVFRRGDWRLLEALPAGDDGFLNLVAYRWMLRDKMKLIVVNLGAGWSQGRIALTGVLKGEGDYLLTDELNGEHYVRSGRKMVNEGLHVVLNGYQSHIFDLTEMS